MAKIYLSRAERERICNRIEDASLKHPQQLDRKFKSYDLQGRYVIEAKDASCLKIKSWAAVFFSFGLLYFCDKVWYGLDGREVGTVYLEAAEKPSTELIKAFQECQEAYQAINSNRPNIQELIQKCKALKELLEKQRCGFGNIAESKKFLDRILNFKNEVRAACLPGRVKPLKGPYTFERIHLSSEQQGSLRGALKEIRAALLMKYFAERLGSDRKVLDQLKAKWEQVKRQPKAQLFIEHQFQRWEKKHKEGKPIAFPKWYHCTDSLESILRSSVRYSKKGAYPGAFFANIPAYAYGKSGIACDRTIEEPGTHDPMVEGVLYPIMPKTVGLDGVRYSNEFALKDLPPDQDRPDVYIGYQRGNEAYLSGERDVEGVPIDRERLIKEGGLDYYIPTIAFIFKKENWQNLERAALNNRVQLLNRLEVDALSKFFQNNFALSLPRQWKGKIEDGRGGKIPVGGFFS